MEKLSIILPVFNEENTIIKILDKIKDVRLLNNIGKEVVIVNDFSYDNTESRILEYIDKNSELIIKYVKKEQNSGKGSAIHTGIDMAAGEYVIVQDADLEYDPGDYNSLLQPIVDGFADVVYGSRFVGGKPHRILFFWHTIGNRFLTLFSNLCTDLNLTDMETCYKVFRKEIIKNIKLTEKRFGFEPEITAKISRIKGIRIYEVGISYYGRTYVEGKKIGWKDGIHAIYCIIKYGLMNLN